MQMSKFNSSPKCRSASERVEVYEKFEINFCILLQVKSFSAEQNDGCKN